MTYFPLLSEGVELAKLFAQQPGGIQSATAAVIASGGGVAGTIITVGPPQVSVARVNPGGNVTGVILQPGGVAGQTVWVANESAYTLTFDSAATSNVADGSADVIQANQARLYVWDSAANSGNGYWFSTPQIINTISLTQSGSAAIVTNGNTITTANVQVARIAPGGVVTGLVLGVGTVSGQLCLVVNQSAIGNTAQFDVAGTSHVADGLNAIIPGLQAQLFVWVNSLWYKISPNLVAGANASIISASAATPSGAAQTIATAGIGVSRTNPGAACTAAILQAGTYPGQEVIVTNEASTGGYTITFDTTAPSNVADGSSDVIAILSARKYVWNGTYWFKCI